MVAQGDELDFAPVRKIEASFKIERSAVFGFMRIDEARMSVDRERDPDPEAAMIHLRFIPLDTPM